MVQSQESGPREVRVSSFMGLNSLLPFSRSLCICVCYYGPLHIFLEGGKVQKQTRQLQGEKYGGSRALATGLLRNGVRDEASQPQLPSMDKGESAPQNTTEIPQFYTFSLRAEV